MSLNPRIQSIQLGVRNIETFKIYPLSMADEFRVTDIFADLAKEWDEMGLQGMSDEGAVRFILTSIKKHIGTIIDMVTDEDNRPALSEIDNVQFSEFVDLIYTVNFESTIKNFQALIERAKSSLVPTKPSLPSSEEVVTE